MSAAVAQFRYAVEPAAEVGDSAILVRLWASGLARGDMAAAKLRWYYEGNPEGRPELFFLHPEADAGAVGVAALGRRRMRLGAETLVAGFTVDFVVEREHRSFFPALTLQKELLRHARPRYPVIFGMPGDRADAVVRRAGYRLIGPMVRSVRLLRSRAWLSRRMPDWLAALAGPLVDWTLLATASLHAPFDGGYQWEWRDRPDAEFDGLWERAARSGTFIGVRDSAFLSWRFVENPFHAHRFFAVVAKRDRRLVAYAVCHGDAGALHVADFLVDPAAPGAGRALWRGLVREAYRGGHRSLSVEFLGAEAVRHDMEAVGMVKREERPIYAVYESRLALADPSRWYVTNADADG